MNATMSLEQIKHHPVMLDQILSIISPQHGGTFIDCTFGGGGYSKAILKFPNTKVLAIDRDQNAQKYADILIKNFPDRFYFFKDKFSNLRKIIKSDTNPKAIIFDLGLSSFQLADLDRGFSFKSKASLSMEMGINKYSAYEIINTLEKEELANIIKFFGDEKEGKKIASKIVDYRKTKPIKTSEELSDIVNRAKSIKKHYKTNPSTKTFQAIRILVNQELTELISGLRYATELLKNNGILVTVSFHSLEDRIVKSFLSLCSNLKKKPSRYLPYNSRNQTLFKTLSKKPLIPTKKEILENNRSRSAKLRYGIRNEESFFYPEEMNEKFSNYFKMEQVRL